MASPFVEMRALALSFESTKDAQDQLFGAIGFMSDINDLYLNVSIQKDHVRVQLQERVQEARAAQMHCEECIYTCQLRADTNLAIAPDDLDQRELALIPLDEYADEHRISPEELAQMSEMEVLQRRLEHDLGELPQLQEHFDAVKAKSEELQERLTAVRRRYSAILPKMQRMYEEILEFAKR
jgi:DNA repair ATPase RecN